MIYCIPWVLMVICLIIDCELNWRVTEMEFKNVEGLPDNKKERRKVIRQIDRLYVGPNGKISLGGSMANDG